MASFSDYVAQDIANIMGDQSEFAEDVTYAADGGTPATIKAIVDINKSNVKGNTFTRTGSSADAFFWIKAVDVPHFKGGDKIVRIADGSKWLTAYIDASANGLYKIACTGSNSIYM